MSLELNHIIIPATDKNCIPMVHTDTHGSEAGRRVGSFDGNLNTTRFR
jgi:hypothetical protein